MRPYPHLRFEVFAQSIQVEFKGSFDDFDGFVCITALDGL
jgi:hypothetical protein